jgi:hypothetical protein
MSLACLQKMKMEAYPATPTPMFDGNLAIGSLRHAGMDCRHPGRRMRPDTSVSTWVPAVHAGTTSLFCNVYETYANLMAIVAPPQPNFRRSARKARTSKIHISQFEILSLRPFCNNLLFLLVAALPR